VATDDQEMERYVRDYAPELDPRKVRAFMAEHDKPEAERDSHVAWATKLLRQRGEGQIGDGPPLDTVADAMRRHDQQQ
jgi:hypothetical protein